jgi:hypothetical protein
MKGQEHLAILLRRAAMRTCGAYALRHSGSHFAMAMSADVEREELAAFFTTASNRRIRRSRPWA